MNDHRTPVTATNTPTSARAARRRASTHLRLLMALAASCVLLAAAAGAAAAATAAPALTLDSFAMPTNFSTAADGNCQVLAHLSLVTSTDICNEYQVTATNAGSVPTDGSTITLTDTLPAGVTLVNASQYQTEPAELWFSQNANAYGDQGAADCSASGQVVQCQLPAAMPPDSTLEMDVMTYVNAGTSGSLTNTASVSGGGATPASTTSTNQISAGAPPFGVSRFSALIGGVDGAPDTQAGDHPYELTTQFDFNNITAESGIGVLGQTDVQDPKDIVVDLPLGFMGSAIAAPTCSFAQLAALNPAGFGVSECPPASQVGFLYPSPFYGPGYPVPGAINYPGIGIPIFNMTPEKGVAAEFGYQDPLGVTRVLYASVVPSPQGYVLQTKSTYTPQLPITYLTVGFFGDPAAKDGAGSTPSAMFTNPSSCDGQPLATTAYIDSWQNPGQYNPDGTPDVSQPGWVKATSSSAPVTGCERLSFQPSLSVQPGTTAADSPAGVQVGISVPQTETPGTLATPPLENGVVTLPPGFTVNPSSAAGLQACSPAQIDLQSALPPTCPQASQVGTAQLQTPLLPGTLQGEIYLATEFDNPSDSLLAGYIVVNDPTTGVVVKIPGSFQLNQTTGQITGVFDNNPQFPFSSCNWISRAVRPGSWRHQRTVGRSPRRLTSRPGQAHSPARTRPRPATRSRSPVVACLASSRRSPLGCRTRRPVPTARLCYRCRGRIPMRTSRVCR